MDDEILKTVESMLGKNVKIVDCEKKLKVCEEEVILINGIPLKLEGNDGQAIRKALITGEVPSCDLLNQLLLRAGVLRQPVHLETSLSVKSSLVTTEEIKIARNGKVLDERTTETKEDNFYTSNCKEVWEPTVKLRTDSSQIPNSTKNVKNFDNSDLATSSSTQNQHINNIGDNCKSIPPYKCSTLLTSSLLSSSTQESTKRSTSPLFIKQQQQQQQQQQQLQHQHLEPPSSKSVQMVKPISISGSSTAVSLVRQDSMYHTADESMLLSTSPSSSSTSSSSSSSSSSSASLSRIIEPIPPSSSCTSNFSFPSSRVASNVSICESATNSKVLNSNTYSAIGDHDNYGTKNKVLLSCEKLFNKIHKKTIQRNHKNNKNHKKNQSISCDSGHDDEENDSDDVGDTDKYFEEVIHDENQNGIDNLTFSCRLSDGDCQSQNDKCQKSNQQLINGVTKTNLPTIFGTVTAEPSPKHGDNRKGLPQNIQINSSQSDGGSRTLTSNKFNNADCQNLESNDNTLVYRDGNLVSGSLNALIQHMVPTNSYYPDKSYLFAFLLTARLFIRPHELLAKISDLCDEQQNLTAITSQLATVSINVPQAAHSTPSSSISSSSSSSTSSTSSTVSASKTAQPTSAIIDFANNFIQMLIEWMETFPYDFRDERVMQHVRAVSQKCILVDNRLRTIVSTMLQNLLQRLTTLEQYEDFLDRLNIGNTVGGIDVTSFRTLSDSFPLSKGQNRMPITVTIDGSTTGKTSSTLVQSSPRPAAVAAPSTPPPPPPPLLPSSSSSIVSATSSPLSSSSSSTQSNLLLSSSSSSSTASTHLQQATTTTIPTTSTILDIIELCSSSTQLAYQLTHIELERLSHIGPEEFVQAFAKENSHLETTSSFNDMKKTRNLESYVQWFNRLSYLVATEVVKQSKKKQRVRVAEYWIETARECFNIGNFNSLMAIIAGLNMSPISRLKKTWAKIHLAKFSVLEHQMDPTSNFNSYRSTLKAAMWRSAGATDERQRIVIPFFTLLVKDLYFLNEGCSNKLPNGHINFEKFWQLAKQVTEFIAWKQVSCPYETIPKILLFLQTNNILDENTLAMASFECEPPDNNHEKERFKTLKLEHHQQQQQQQQQQQHLQQQQQQQQRHHSLQQTFNFQDKT